MAVRPMIWVTGIARLIDGSPRETYVEAGIAASADGGHSVITLAGDPDEGQAVYLGDHTEVSDPVTGAWMHGLAWAEDAAYRIKGAGAPRLVICAEHAPGSTVAFDALPLESQTTPSDLITLQVIVASAVEDYLTAHPPTGGGGVTDHGALTGLGEDDHPHYLTAARGDARYVLPGSLAPVATTGDYASLTGTVPTSALPPLAINTVTVVASQAAMLALTAERGDMAIRTDTGLTYVLATD